MRRFAEDTEVSVEKTRAEIEKVLANYGASAFGYGWQDSRAAISFEAHGRRIAFHLPLPERSSRQFTQKSRGYGQNSQELAQKKWEQACRSRWRALLLAIKAKLEVVECKISTFEEEFMAHIILPNGRTVSDTIAPQLDAAYRTGQMPPLLGYTP